MLKTEYKYGQYRTPLNQSDCTYFFVLAIRVDKGSEFHNRSMKSWLEKNDIEMYSTHN